MPETSRLGSKDLTRILDLAPHEVPTILSLGRSLKSNYAPYRDAFCQRSIVLLFEMPSLRTRVSFEIGFARFGGIAVYLDHQGNPIGSRESIEDYGRNLERWCDCVVARTMRHETIGLLATSTSVPVINALSHLHHPCQALADFMTLSERGFDPRRHQIAWIGDGNNVCHSLIEMTATMGSAIIVVTPEGHEPDDQIMRDAHARACRSGASIEVSSDPDKVRGVFAVYTDAWTSMGHEETPERTARFLRYQVDARRMLAAGSQALFMHCLPAHRGQEVTDEVIDSGQSVVFDQAENRLHIQNALLLNLIATPTDDPIVRSRRNHAKA